MIIHNSGKYAYVLHTYPVQQQYASTLYLYHINQTTAALTRDARVQAKYGPDYFYLEWLVSINKAGTRLYDVWSVQFDGENNYYYSYHPISTTTGQLGRDVGKIFYASNYTGLDEQDFTTNLILNLHNDNNGQPSVLNVFPNVKNPKQPLFQCTQSMLAACGDSYTYWVSVDEQYVFLQDTPVNNTVIGHIDTANKRIVQTDIIPGVPPLYFSPEDRLIYGVDSLNGVVQVYLFNSLHGTVTLAARSRSIQ